MREYEDAVEIIEALVSRLLMESAIESPPVDPFVIAKKRRITLSELEMDGRRGQNLVMLGNKFIDVQRHDRPERKCYTMAHELIEVELPDEISEREERHEIATMGAAYLLMPTEWFREACHDTEFDIFELKRTFSTASHEAIALRTLTFSPAVITIIDDNRISNRKASTGWFSPRKLLPVEKDAAGRAYSSGKKTRVDFENGTVTAFPLLEEEVKRVILRTVFSDDCS